MSIVRWSDRFNLDIAAIDDAHRHLFETLDRLHAELLGERRRPVIQSILDYMADYTRTHFAEEEALMAQMHDPALERHRAAHRALVDRLARIAADWRSGDAHASVEFFGFLLGDWLWRHIMEVDMKLRTHAPDDRHAADT